ncbi:MAG: histone deacetylase family protein [Rhodospirillales bacterium]|nr:histone deacetylase family protein [Rhodospirillales bacterium]
MTTLLFTHPICIEHNPGTRHPECPDRLRAVVAALDGEAFSALDRREAPVSDEAPIERVHSTDHIRQILDNVPTEDRVYLDPDTAMSPASGEAGLRAVGAACAAVDAVMSGDGHNAFCAVRPPGHHAERDRAMGFCLFNTVAIAANHAKAAHGLSRVAVVDFDVHHGNGTQSAFYDDETLFFGSSHQWPAYPGTGSVDETGASNSNCNGTLVPGAGSREFRAAWANTILPELETFGPELIIISAGFDAHARDPLANLEVQTGDYAWVTKEIMAVADRCCDGRVVSSLEGGYDLSALAESAAVHVQALMDH